MGEIAGRFARAAPSVSEHLRILREAEPVSERRDVNRIRYAPCRVRAGRSPGTICPEQIVPRHTRGTRGHPMRQPRLASTVERRLLVNYRVDPDVTAGLLPARLRPQLHRGWAVGGICLLRIGGARPAWSPCDTGLRSENAAHRFAVEWDGPDGRPQTGVYIPRRDSGSRLNVAVGGRLFPGEHHRARFDVAETPERLEVAFEARDGSTRVDVGVDVVPELSGSELFQDLAEASAFFRCGATGWSETSSGLRLDGMLLETADWRVAACRVRHVESSYFAALPAGSAELDCALVMRDVAATWKPLPAMARAAA